MCPVLALTAAGSPPAGDDAVLPRVVAGVRSRHRDVAGVGVGGDVGETKHGDIVGEALVSVVGVVRMLLNG